MGHALDLLDKLYISSLRAVIFKKHYYIAMSLFLL